MFVLLISTNPRSFYFAEYEFLTAVLVDTKLWGNYLFWGMTRSAETAQLSGAHVTVTCFILRPMSGTSLRIT